MLIRTLSVNIYVSLEVYLIWLKYIWLMMLIEKFIVSCVFWKMWSILSKLINRAVFPGTNFFKSTRFLHTFFINYPCSYNRIHVICRCHWIEIRVVVEGMCRWWWSGLIMHVSRFQLFPVWFLNRGSYVLIIKSYSTCFYGFS